MVKKAFIRANIPFVMEQETVFSDEFIQSASEKGWTKCEMQGDFLLKHINASFKNNVACFSKICDKMDIVIPFEDPQYISTIHNYSITISEVQVYCFDTGTGICSFYIPYDCDTDEEAIINSCSVLHCSVLHSDGKMGKVIFCNGNKTYLSCLAEQFLNSLLEKTYCLFGTSNDTGLRRINMFSAVLCDNNDVSADAEQYGKLCYQLANAYDNRANRLFISEQDLYRQHDYTRWCFSKRGCAVVANLTGIAVNDNFLNARWFFSINSNYFYLYLMVLHQKFATYNYLNNIAEDPNMEHLTINQKSLIDFNAKYIFSVVSDEQFIQDVYFRLKEATNADKVYEELLEQLKRMFDYAQFKSAEINEIKSRGLNLISVIISVVCSVSIIFDTINLFLTHGYTFGFQSFNSILFTGVVFVEILLFIIVLAVVFIINRNKR